MEKGEASGNTGNNAGTDTGADSVSRMLKGEIVSLGSSFSLDLDQDGTAENIQMSVQEMVHRILITFRQVLQGLQIMEKIQRIISMG